MASFYYLRGNSEQKKVYITVSSGKDFSVQKATRFKVDASAWDQKKSRMDVSKTASKAYKKEMEIINNDLDEYQKTVDEYVDDLKERGLLTETKVSDFISNLNGKKKSSVTTPTLFTEFVEYYISQKPWLSDGTAKAYRRTSNIVFRTFPNTRMADIDDSFKKKFAKMMIDNEYQMSYIRKTLRNIRDFWKFGSEKGLALSNDPQSWELTKEFPDLKSQKYTDPYLNMDELELIKNIELPSDYLDNARDWLIISCWTAQRVSDLMEFKADKITDQHGEKFITISQRKTGKEITIPLFKEVERILSKRDGNFPRSISEQKYNQYIKKVCQLAGLDQEIHGAKRRQKTIVNGRLSYRNEVGNFPKYELITSHVGRRSFISNFLRQIDADKIKQMSGHGHTAMVELYDKTESILKAADLKLHFKDAGIE